MDVYNIVSSKRLSVLWLRLLIEKFDDVTSLNVLN